MSFITDAWNWGKKTLGLSQPDAPSTVAPTPNADAYNQWGYDVANRYEGLGQGVQDRNAAQTSAAQIDYSRAFPALAQAGQNYGQAGQNLQGSEMIGGLNQIQLMDALKGRAYGTAGPSVAEIRMAQAADEAQRRNAALAASGTGPSRAAAQLAAINANAGQQGQLVRDLGAQRAAEQIAAQQELGQAAASFRGLGQQGAQTLGGLGTQYAGLGGLYGGFAQQQAGLNQQTNLANLDAIQNQQARNDAMQQFYFGLGDQARQQQNEASIQMDTNRGNWAIGQAGVNAQNYGSRLQDQGGRFAATLGLVSGVAAGLGKGGK